MPKSKHTKLWEVNNVQCGSVITRHRFRYLLCYLRLGGHERVIAATTSEPTYQNGVNTTIYMLAFVQFFVDVRSDTYSICFDRFFPINLLRDKVRMRKEDM